MKRLTVYAAAILLGALAALPAQAQKKITFGHQQVFDLAPILLAQEKGFFKKHGLEVALKPIPLNSQNPAALEAGEVDIAMPTASGTESTLLGPRPMVRSELMPRTWR